jgi:hypothetical protein
MFSVARQLLQLVIPGISILVVAAYYLLLFVFSGA